jgi:Integrase core domain/HTH-like domain
VRWLWEHYLVSQRQVCGLMVLAESSFRYVSRRNDEPLRERLREAARSKPRWGYRRLQIVLDQRGEHVNHKRIYRVYRKAGLMIRRKARKRLLRAGSPRPVLTAANQEWALDFVQDAAESGRKFRALSVVDPYTRECLALEVDTRMGSRRVTRVLDGIIAERGVPQALRSDNGFRSLRSLQPCLSTPLVSKNSLVPEVLRAGVHQPSFSGLVPGKADRAGAYGSGQAGAERARGKFSREVAG